MWSWARRALIPGLLLLLAGCAIDPIPTPGSGQDAIAAPDVPLPSYDVPIAMDVTAPSDSAAEPDGGAQDLGPMPSDAVNDAAPDAELDGRDTEPVDTLDTSEETVVGEGDAPGGG